VVKPNNKIRDIEKKMQEEKEIKAEFNRINKIYKELPKEKIKILEGLIDEAAFMKITLKGLRNTLHEEGVTELFEQGEQKIIRRHPCMDIYTTMVNRYSIIMKQLIDLFPPEEKKEEVDKLMNFVKKGVDSR
jgi:hypothetical protein